MKRSHDVVMLRDGEAGGSDDGSNEDHRKKSEQMAKSR